MPKEIKDQPLIKLIIAQRFYINIIYQIAIWIHVDCILLMLDYCDRSDCYYSLTISIDNKMNPSKSIVFKKKFIAQNNFTRKTPRSARQINKLQSNFIRYCRKMYIFAALMNDLINVYLPNYFHEWNEK